MLYYNINYYHNRFFIINNKYYIYVYINKKKHYIYQFELINEQLYLFIINKNINTSDNFQIKIMYDNKSIKININNLYNNYINIGKIDKLNYKNNNNINNDNITINNKNIDDDNNFYKLFPNFEIDYYISNNKFIKSNECEREFLNTKFIKYHWYYCGQYQPQYYFKYLLHKYKDIITNLNYCHIKYDSSKKNTLLFIDDRYDKLFKYLLILFIYSVDNTWNITVFTTENNMKYYQEDFDSIRVEGKIILLKEPFKNMYEYSAFFKNYKLWESIKEDNCLTFQYDSFAMGKFRSEFFNYYYIGAKWPHNACMNTNIKIGNGGTSFRKTRLNEALCKKYKDKTIKKNYVEDIFFAELLYEEGFLNATEEICDLFSFENVYCENSIYAHQIYNTISLADLDYFIYRKLSNLSKINI
jgi:hypothetical protein